jgi:hypothetical protein
VLIAPPPIHSISRPCRDWHHRQCKPTDQAFICFHLKHCCWGCPRPTTELTSLHLLHFPFQMLTFLSCPVCLPDNITIILCLSCCVSHLIHSRQLETLQGTWLLPLRHTHGHHAQMLALGAASHVARGSRHTVRTWYCRGSHPCMQTEYGSVLIDADWSMQWCRRHKSVWWYQGVPSDHFP